MAVGGKPKAVLVRSPIFSDRSLTLFPAPEQSGFELSLDPDGALERRLAQLSRGAEGQEAVRAPSSSLSRVMVARQPAFHKHGCEKWIADAGHCGVMLEQVYRRG